MFRAPVPNQVTAAIRQYSPRTEFGKIVRECLKWLPAEHAAELLEGISRIVVIESSLAITVFRGWMTKYGVPGDIEHYGIVGRKVVTDAGVAFIVDAFQNSVELENLKFHALGTGTTAESAAQTALVTELTTEYTGNVRATGTTTEGATANIYRTVGTNTMDEAPGAALREHAVMSQAATGGGTMLDRTLYSAITLASGDALQSTYELTCSAGG
jgi:hypothetical protein